MANHVVKSLIQKCKCLVGLHDFVFNNYWGNGVDTIVIGCKSVSCGKMIEAEDISKTLNATLKPTTNHRE